MLLSHAQPNFTRADMPDIGDHDSIMILQYHPITNNLDTETDTDYNWDFSSLPFHVQNFIDIDSFRVKTHHVSEPFVNATIEEYKTGVTAQTVNLFSYSNDTLYIHRLGDISNNWALAPIASIAFPITFNNSSIINADIYTASILVGERRTTTLYDGFGTLLMPDNKSYSNVFRVRRTERDSSYVTNTSITYTSYIWYRQGGQIPLLQLVYTGAANLYFVFGSKANGTSSGIDDVNFRSDFTISPNPSNGKFEISVEGFLPELIEIYNLQGEKVLQSRTASEIDLSCAAKGIYIIKITSGTNKYLKKIILN